MGILKREISLSGVAIWGFLFILFPLISGSLSFPAYLKIIGFVSCSFIIGTIVLDIIKLEFNYNLIKTAASIFLGSFLLLPIFLLLGPGLLFAVSVYCLLLASLILVFKKYRVTLVLKAPEVVSFVLVFILVLLVFGKGDLIHTISSQPVKVVGGSWDPVYFTSLVTSLRHGFIGSNWNELDTSLNYQTGSFLVPAAFASFTGIGSHIALWGIWMPFYMLSGIMLLGSWALYVCESSSIRFSLWTLPILCCAIILLAPIHPLYLLQGDLEKIIFLGTGFLLPGGNPPFTGGFLVLAFCLMLSVTYFEKKPTFGKRLFYVLFLSFLVLFKIPLFYCAGVLFGLISFYLALKRKNFYLLLDNFLALIISLMLFKVNYLGSSMQVFELKFGYLFYKYSSLIQSTSLYKGIGVVLLLIGVWGAIKFLLIGYAISSNYTTVKVYSISFFCVLLISYLPALLLNLYLVDLDGSILQNLTFDLEQFVRAAYFFGAIVALPGIVLLVNANRKRIYEKAILGLVVVWMCLVAVSGIYKSSVTSVVVKENDWYPKVVAELREKPGKLYAVVPSDEFSGQFLTANDVGPFWVTSERILGGYAMNNENSWRWDVIRQSISLNAAEQKNAYATLKKSGVDYIIVNPNNFEDFKRFAKVNSIKMNPNSWLLGL